MKRHSAKPAQHAHDQRTPGAADSEALHDQLHEMAILRLQRTIGNHLVQRLLATRDLQRQPELLQRDPPAAPPASAAPATSDEITFEEGMFVGNAEFHAKALPKNQYYAQHPPQPGWPYTAELEALWAQGAHTEFADQVAGVQYFSMKLARDKVDGILGKRTAAGLVKSQAPTNPAPAPATEQAPAPTPAAEETTVGATPTQLPQAPARAEASDPALQKHPVASRILTPVKQTIKEYTTAAKQAEKATKEPDRPQLIATAEELRTAARTAMADARSALAGLQPGEFAGGEAEMRRVVAFINRELNANTIYYAQGFNADILSGNGKAAAARTCNMTVIAMMVEALGKSSKDYQGGDIAAIAAQYGKQLGINNTRPEDLASLRLPDFLQLAAIDVAGGRAEAAANITAHSFIIKVAKHFGLRLTEMKGEQAQERKEGKDDSFLSTKYTAKLDTIGALFRPAYNDAKKALSKDQEYKKLDDAEKKIYLGKYIQDFTEQRRLAYLGNVTQWIAIDTATHDTLSALQAEFNAPSVSNPGQPRTFAEIQDKLDETIAILKEQHAGLPKEFKAKAKELGKLVGAIEKARTSGLAKPSAAPKALLKLLGVKGDQGPLKQIATNLRKYAGLQTIYEKVATPEGMEELVPVDDYKASIIPTMQAAIDSGNQVMVNLDGHFVRLQSLSDEGIIIDDPGTRYGENNTILWEDARKFGYFQRYLLLSP